MTVADTETGELVDLERHIRPFAEWLLEQAGGTTHNDLGIALNDLVEAVSATGKKGTLTLVIEVKPASRGVAQTSVLVTDDIKVKPPVSDRAASVYFVDRSGNLRRDNPDQMKLPLREVPAAPTPDADSLREAGRG